MFVTKEEWTRKANVDDVNDGLQLKANKDMVGEKWHDCYGDGGRWIRA